MQDKAQLISELDIDSVWRVDTGLLSLEEVKTSNFREGVYSNHWYLAMSGIGCYCYFTNKQKAIEAIKVEIEEKIQELKDHLDSLN